MMRTVGGGSIPARWVVPPREPGMGTGRTRDATTRAERDGARSWAMLFRESGMGALCYPTSARIWESPFLPKVTCSGSLLPGRSITRHGTLITL